MTQTPKLGPILILGKLSMVVRKGIRKKSMEKGNINGSGFGLRALQAKLELSMSCSLKTYVTM